MIQLPPYLKKGDTIGIVCPAGKMEMDKATTCIQVLQQWGYRVQKGPTLGGSFHYFAGTDAERLQDLQHMLDDDNIKAILCGRGGYGTSRIIDNLDFRRFKKHPKWVIGFSDITVLLAHITTRFNIATLHAPMAAAFNNLGYENEYVQSLRKALKGSKAKYTCPPHALNRQGKATGQLVGGNLAIIAHLIGSASAYKTRGKILFIEDVGEYLYTVDRMMIQLKRAGLLNGLKGLIIGGFSDMKDTVVPFGTDIYQLLHHHLKDYNYPYCFDFAVSHNATNYALKVGVEYTLHISSKQVVLKEQ
jgi:muramoyltetrapeptide carboxypeptidase